MPRWRPCSEWAEVGSLPCATQNTGSERIMARVIFVTGSLSYGGAERHAVALMNRLTERGHECHAVYIKNIGDQLDRLRLGEYGTVRCLNADRYFDRRALADFAAHLSLLRPSVVVAANPYALLYSWL